MHVNESLAWMEGNINLMLRFIGTHTFDGFNSDISGLSSRPFKKTVNTFKSNSLPAFPVFVSFRQTLKHKIRTSSCLSDQQRPPCRETAVGPALVSLSSLYARNPGFKGV